MTPTNPTTKSSAPGYVKVLAPPFEGCMRCGERNRPTVGNLWRVADERGLTYQCDVCGHSSPKCRVD